MTQKKFNTKALKQNVVICTWKNTLKDESDLPSDWTKLSGVLVGMSHSEHLRRQHGQVDPP